MKKNYIQLLILMALGICQVGFSPMFIKAQTYHKLIRVNTYWDNYYTSIPCYTYIHRIYFTGNDTIIGGQTYNKSRQFNFESVNPGSLCPPFVIDNVSYSTGIYIREDTVARKVFTYDNYFTQPDQLFYDFSLEVGDTLHSLINGNNTFVVSSIENVTLHNGEIRRMFIFNNMDNVYYIESLGGSQGLFRPIDEPIGNQGGYFCISENGINLWGFNCNYFFVGINQINTKDILAITLNPTKSYLNIHLNKTLHNITFSLWDMSGQLITLKTITETETQVDLNGIPPGLYLAQFVFDEGTVNSKIIIQ